MRRCFILLAIVAMALVGSSSAASVCPNAKFGNDLPGGWTRLTRPEIKSNETLQKNVDDTAASKYPKCDVKSTQVLKACTQVVAGLNYEYVARATLTCGGKKEVRYFTKTFLVPPTGR